MSFSPPSLFRLFRANRSKSTQVALLRQFVTNYPNSDLTQEGKKKKKKEREGGGITKNK